MRRSILLAFALLLLASLSSFADDKPARAILVLDASGSMWGQIQGKTKIEIAREVVARLVQSPDFKIELGLTAYGHRRKGDCADIEQLIPVAAGNGKRIVQAVNALKPKGKTPLSDAVKKAAEQLRYSEEKATVILVTDGKETCDRDPCALGKALEAKGVDFTTHVIGFNVAKQERAGLKCLADATGGMFLTAEDAGALTASLDAAVDQVKAGPEPGARLIAVVGDSTEPAPMAVEWTLFKATEGDARGEPILKEAGASIMIRPDSGRYVVEARASNVAGQAVIDIEAGKDSQHRVPLEAGKAVLSALAETEGPLFKAKEPVFWRIYPVSKGKAAKKYIASLGGNPATFMLSPGDYLGQAVSGSTEGEVAFSITAGKTAEVKLVLASGKVELKALSNTNGPLFKGKRDVYWRIYPLGPDGERTKRYLTSNKGNPRRFTLPPGSYVATAESNKLHGEVLFKIAPDQAVEALTVLNQSSVTLKLLSSAGGAVFVGDKPVSWQIHRFGVDGKRGKRTASGRGNPLTVELGTGEFEAQYRSGKIRGKQRFKHDSDHEPTVEVILNGQ